MNKNIIIIVLTLAIIVLTYININGITHTPSGDTTTEQSQIIIDKLMNKSLLEIQIMLGELNKETIFIDNCKDSLLLEEIPSNSICFFFNNDGCKSCNAEYIENEFERLLQIAEQNSEIDFIIFSNFDNFREFYSHSLRFNNIENLRCYNSTNMIFWNEEHYASDMFYFVIGDNQIIKYAFIPNYFSDEINITFFNQIIKKISHEI